jgi:hypothetical protein
MTSAPLRVGRSLDRHSARLAAEPHSPKATGNLSLRVGEKHLNAVSRAVLLTTRGRLDARRLLKTHQRPAGQSRSHLPQPLLDAPPRIENPSQTRP